MVAFYLRTIVSAAHTVLVSAISYTFSVSVPTHKHNFTLVPIQYYCNVINCLQLKTTIFLSQVHVGHNNTCFFKHTLVFEILVSDIFFIIRTCFVA